MQPNNGPHHKKLEKLFPRNYNRLFGYQEIDQQRDRRYCNTIPH